MTQVEKRDYSIFPAGMANRFELTAVELAELLDHRREDDLAKLGGVEGMIKLLESDAENGLPQSEITQEFADRKTQYGVNYIPPGKKTSFLSLWFGALKDTTLIILLVAAVVSLIIGIVMLEDDPLGWIDGVAIFIAVFIVATVTAVNDFSKEKQFRKLNEQKVNRIVKVIRAGLPMEISVHDVVVGDLCVVDTGDAFPADGLYVSGFNAMADESAMTGESDFIKKNPSSPFCLSGTNLVEGQLLMLATGVGPNSQWGVILQKLGNEEEGTPLQAKLDKMAKYIGFVGLGAGVCIFIALVGRWIAREVDLVEDIDGENGPFAASHFIDWLDYFIIVITVIVVAIPEGLPLAVTISLAFSMKRMLKDKNFVRKLAACETMGGCEAICSDKTGTLTKNQMTVVRMLAGNHLYNVEEDMGKKFDERSTVGLNKSLLDLICANSAVNSTANLLPRDRNTQEEEVDDDPTMANMPFVSGSKTEGALLILSDLLGCPYTPIRHQLPLVDKLNFSSSRKRMSSVISIEQSEWSGTSMAPMNIGALYNAEQPYRVFVKGASEIVLGLCTKRVDDDGNIVPLDPATVANINERINEMATSSLRTIVLAYRDVTEETIQRCTEIDQIDEPSVRVELEGVADGERIDFGEKSNPKEELFEQDLIFCGLVGIKDPLRPGVKEAIERCHHAGIVVRMITGDNIQTACAIASECGIYKPEEGHKAVEGPAFRMMTDEEIDVLIPDLRVMARSSPSDKHRMVERIKVQFHKVVAVTGDGTNDAPALSVADVGLAMGIAGTEVAREASDIVILDDNFKSIVRAVEWGRAVMANIRKFLQFQLTVNVVALVATFVGSVANGVSPFNSVELLYVNLIMDSMGSLALATEGPTANILDAPPVGRNEFLLTPKMIRNIIIQCIWQLAAIFTILFGGRAIFSIPLLRSEDGTKYMDGKYDERFQDMSQFEFETIYLNSVLYNAFIWCQVFNEFVARRINNELNFFDNLKHCPVFWVVIAVTIVLHLVLFFFAEVVLSTVRIGWVEFVVGIGIGLITWPLGVIGRFIPVGERIIITHKTKTHSSKKPAEAIFTDGDGSETSVGSSGGSDTGERDVA